MKGITLEDLKAVADKLDAQNVPKWPPVEIRANAKTTELILKDVKPASYDEKLPVAWGMISFAPIFGIPFIKDESISDNFVKVGEIWYELNLGASGNIVSITRYEKQPENEKEN